MGRNKSPRTNRAIKCAYNECMLPNDNSKFAIQFFYLLVSILFLFKSASSFTFFAILMYTAPILLDLVYTGMSNIIFRIVKTVFLVFNAFLIVFCFLGLFGFIVDRGSSFQVASTSLIIPNFYVDKVELAKPLLAELIVPVSMFFGSPNKRAKAAIEYVVKEVK